MSPKTFILLLSALLFYAPSLFALSEDKTLACSLNHQTLRLCSAKNINDDITSANLILCENTQKNSSYIKLLQVFKNGSRNNLIVSGTLTPDPNNNLSFVSLSSNNLIKIYFTNDYDEAYVDLTSGASSMTLYCN